MSLVIYLKFLIKLRFSLLNLIFGGGDDYLLLKLPVLFSSILIVLFWIYRLIGDIFILLAESTIFFIW